MRIKRNKSSYHCSSITRRDFRHDHSDKPAKFSSRKDTARWCRGKVGRPHTYERFQRGYRYKYTVAHCIVCGRDSYTRAALKSSLPLHIDIGYACYCDGTNYGNWEDYHKVAVRTIGQAS